MPREAQFDVKEKLGQALQLFWRQGYHATSMADIKAELDLYPGSIYSAFGNKRELYIKALDLYQESAHHMFKRLSEIESPKERILFIFNSIIGEIESSIECKGCFMLNASLEVAPHDREVQLLADKANQRLRSFFREEILKAQAAKEVSKNVDPESISEMLILILYGMRVRARTQATADEMKSALVQVTNLLSA